MTDRELLERIYAALGTIRQDMGGYHAAVNRVESRLAALEGRVSTAGEETVSPEEKEAQKAAEAFRAARQKEWERLRVGETDELTEEAHTVLADAWMVDGV